MKLKEWALSQNLHPSTAYRWFAEGTLPVRAERVGPRTILVLDVPAVSVVSGGIGLHARVSSHDQKADLARQLSRLESWRR
jgi:putative resolvase